jgi:flagellar biosynthesis/type III secretory pathway chaperone
MTSPVLDPSRLDAAQAHAERLRQLLEDEFLALKRQSLEDFEAIQPSKNDLLEQLSRTVGTSQAPEANELNPQWQGFRQAMTHCRDLHRRNEILISRQLDTIRGTLQALQGNPLGGADEVYDRLGQVRGGRRARGYSLA